ncbi:MAG: HesB/IscA family protein, partial [Solirubrobacterales bacterium]
MESRTLERVDEVDLRTVHVGKVLRVGVKGGGCSGFQYQLAFDEQRENDITFEDKGLLLLVDPQHLAYVDGSEIDFVDSLQGAGFPVNNPNVVAA